MLYKTCAKVFNRKRKADTGDSNPSEQPIFYKLFKKKTSSLQNFQTQNFTSTQQLAQKL